MSDTQALTPDAVLAAAIDRHAEQPGGLLPLLHDVQDRLGYVPPEAVPAIARAMHRSVAEVHGVIRFYPHYRSSAPGRHVVRLCLAEACQAMGARDLLAHARARLEVDLHGTTADGAVTLEPVYCLGNCACAPAVLVDAELVGRVDAGRFDELIAGCRSEA
jgi:formate dehydrogenase subunit gamma